MVRFVQVMVRESEMGRGSATDKGPAAVKVSVMDKGAQAEHETMLRLHLGRVRE